MAEESRDDGGGSWWSCWFEAAKVKSSEALEFMKRDLTELSQTVQQDTVAAVSSTAAAVSTTAAILKEKLRVDGPDSVTNKAKQGISTFINTLSEVFLPIREENNDEIFLICNSQPVLLDRWQTQLHAIRTDPNTYCHEPEGPPELYEAWLEIFNLDSHQDEISDIMINCKEVKALYANLVPAAVSHVEFWQRYYYRVHLLKEAEAKRSELMRRAEMRNPNDLSWDDDDVEGNPPESPSKKRKTITQKEEIEQDFPGLQSSIVATSMHQTAITKESKNQDKLILDCSNEKQMNKHCLKQNQLISINQIDQRHLSEKLRFTEKAESQLSSELQTDIYSEEDIKKQMLSKHTTNILSSAADEQSLDKSDTTLGGIVSREKGDMVVVGTKNSISPASSDTALRDGSTEDDWEQDFDLILNEEDLKTQDNIERISRQPVEGDEDWESWE